MVIYCILLCVLRATAYGARTVALCSGRTVCHSSAQRGVTNKLTVWLFTGRLSNRLLNEQTICLLSLLFSVSSSLLFFSSLP